MLIGSATLRRLSGLPGRGTVRVPGWLTSESEERETWTAESLRAALLRGPFDEGQPSTEGLQQEVAGRDFGGLTFLGRHCFRAGGMRASSAELEVCTCAHEKIVGPRQTL